MLAPVLETGHAVVDRLEEVAVGRGPQIVSRGLVTAFEDDSQIKGLDDDQTVRFRVVLHR